VERLDRLAPGVIKLSRLPNRQTAGAQHEDLPEDGRQRIGDRGHARALGLGDVADEVPEEECRVRGAAACLWVELHREPRPYAVDDAFVASIIRIHHEGHPTCRQGGAVDSKTVVLRCDVAFGSAQVNNRLVHPAIPKLHFVGGRAGCQSEDLVPKANSEYWRCGTFLHQRAHMADRLLTHCGITRPIAQEEAVELVLSEIVVPWNHCDIDAQHVHQVTEDVVLHTQINCKNMYAGTGRHLCVDFCLFRHTLPVWK